MRKNLSRLLALAVIAALIGTLTVKENPIRVMQMVVAAAGTPTATATLTATATAAATPLPTPTGVAPLYSRITDFGFIGVPLGQNGIYGGRIIRLVSTLAIPLGCVAAVDPNIADQVVAANPALTTPLGVVVGAAGVASGAPYGGIGVAPIAGQKAVIQVNGIASVACGGTIAGGNAVMVSATYACAVDAYSAGTVDEQVGIALKSCVVGGRTDILITK